MGDSAGKVVAFFSRRSSLPYLSLLTTALAFFQLLWQFYGMLFLLLLLLLSHFSRVQLCETP